MAHIDPVIAILDQAGLLKASAIDALDKQISPAMCRDLTNEIERIVTSSGRPQAPDPDGLHLVGGGQLSLASPRPCSHLDCRAARTRQAARWVALYADTIWIQPVGIAPIHQLASGDSGHWDKQLNNPWNPILRLKEDLKCLSLIRPLAEAGIVRFLPPGLHFCRKHGTEFKSSLRSLVRKVLSSIRAKGYIKFKRYAPEVATVEIFVPLLSPGHPLFSFRHAPKARLDHLEKEFRHLGRVQRDGIKVEGQNLTKMSVIREDVEEHSFDLMYRMFWCHNTDLHLATDDTLDEVVLSDPQKFHTHNNRDLHEPWQVQIENGLQLPYLKNLELEEILDLRNKYEMSWMSLRRRLREIAMKAEQNPDDAPTLWRAEIDLLQEEVRDLREKLYLRKSRDRKAAQMLVLGGGLVGSLYIALGGGGSAASGLISALATCEAVFGGKEVLDSHALRSESKLRPAYFLLQSHNKLVRRTSRRTRENMRE